MLQVTECVEIGLPTLVVFVFISQASWSCTVVYMFALSHLILVDQTFTEQECVQRISNKNFRMETENFEEILNH